MGYQIWQNGIVWFYIEYSIMRYILKKLKKFQIKFSNFNINFLGNFRKFLKNLWYQSNYRIKTRFSMQKGAKGTFCLQYGAKKNHRLRLPREFSFSETGLSWTRVAVGLLRSNDISSQKKTRYCYKSEYNTTNKLFILHGDLILMQYCLSATPLPPIYLHEYLEHG